MTEEMYNKIVEHIRDEIDDVAEYKALCEQADGYTREVIRRIALDEESHARYLAKVLKSNGRDMPDDVWSEYQDMEQSFREESRR